ncbi:MAG: Fe-S cluster assembly protein IscX [Limisphaerales bacterium]|jgi:FeS assembly protein IscX|nr:Fe-S cluster assembly protein IscX [Verrucomicrobiota bacterium]
MELNWDDTDQIGWALADAYPDMDPLSLSFPRLQEMVMQLPGFKGTEEGCSEGVLESIQMVWYEEVR